MLLYHPIRKTYADFEKVYRYRFDDKNGTMIETDKELESGQIVILRDISEYAIVITKVWEEDGKKYFLHDSAEKLVVRARKPLDRGFEISSEGNETNRH